MSSITEQLMRQYPILSAAWDECSMIWKGVEQDGTIHKFNRKAMRKIVKDEQAKVDDRLIGGNDHMINPEVKTGDRIICYHMESELSVPPGTKGTVVRVSRDPVVNL